MELEDHREETEDSAEEVQKPINKKSFSKRGLIEIVVPVLTLMTIVNCIVILISVMNIGRKVNGLEQRLMILQNNTVVSASHMAEERALSESSELMDVADIDGSVVDGAEAEDIVEAAALEDNHRWEGREDSSAGIRRVYLTFDDGPSANTDRILDILNQYGVKATFFVVGKENYTDQYRRIVEDGHTLAMHSYSHKYSEIYASVDAYRQDLTQLHDFLYEITGEDCNIVRFPGGSSNTISSVDMWDLIDYLNREGMVYFDWNVSSGDASGSRKSAAQITRNVIDNIDQYNNAVVLFHDAPGKDSTVDALSTIIEKILESDNTVILPITEDTVTVQHLHE